MSVPETTGWPSAERLPEPPARRAVVRKPLPRAAWVLALAAFLCGVGVSAAAFSMGWRSQAQHGASAETALVAKTAQAQALTASLASARAATARLRSELAAAQQAKIAARASAQIVSREASALAASLATTGQSAVAVALDAASLGADVDRLSRELKTLTSYLTTTPASQLDPGYIATQVAYLTKQLTALQGARGDLGTAISAFQTAAKKLATEAGTLSGRD